MQTNLCFEASERNGRPGFPFTDAEYGAMADAVLTPENRFHAAALGGNNCFLTGAGGTGKSTQLRAFIAECPRRVSVTAPTETRFVAARVTDNRWNNPEYMRVLEGLTGWQRRAWLDGDWVIAAGQFFTTLRREVHVISDFDETRAREWFCALDYGFTHYTVVLLGCTDGDGNLFIVDEHAERLWLPQRHAPGIAAMLARHSISGRRLEIGDLKRFVAGADVFSRQSDGSTVASQYGKLGITLRPANMERVSGWAEILHRFGDPANGVKPRLFIHERCARLVECLPALQHDPNRPEDVLKVDCDEDGAGGDDAADTLRYLVATKSRTVTQRKLRGL